MGAGGIGGIVAATLTEVGSAVTAVSTNTADPAAVDNSGYRVIDDGEERVVRGWMSPAPDGSYDLCILATQPPNVEDAALTALRHLADDAEVVVLQNGLCEERVASIVGAERVIGAIVAWGASMPEPGRYERTAHGGFSIGRLSGQVDDDLRRVGELLEAIGPVSVTQNLRGARWSKLALNCAVSALGTIAGERLGPLVRVRRYRRLALEIMTEVVAVAQAEGVQLEKVAGTLDLDWVALSEADRGRDRLGQLDREARAAARGRPALPPDAELDARGDRAQADAGDRLPQRRGRHPRQHARHRDADQRADRRDGLGDREGRRWRRRARRSTGSALVDR